MKYNTQGRNILQKVKSVLGRKVVFWGDDTTDDDIIEQAMGILSERLFNSNKSLSVTDPSDVRKYLRLSLAEKEHEVFGVLFLDNQHRLIAYTEMFRGTIDGASIHAREVVKSVLSYNAAAVIFAHNHPSGLAEPSEADRRITERLKSSLSLIDVRVLDHLIVGENDIVSFAERGLL